MANPIRIAIAGAGGRMGQALIASVLAAPDHRRDAAAALTPAPRVQSARLMRARAASANSDAPTPTGPTPRDTSRSAAAPCRQTA